MWLAQRLSILTQFIPGDESAATATEESCILPASSQLAGFQVQLPSIATDILKLLFEYTTCPSQPGHLLHTTTENICRSRARRGQDQSSKALLLSCDWHSAPLTHLLRSGTSPVFRGVPSGEDASEVDRVERIDHACNVISGDATRRVKARFEHKED